MLATRRTVSGVVCGDVLVQIKRGNDDVFNVDNEGGLTKAVDALEAGDAVTLVVVRDFGSASEKQMEVSLTLPSS